MFSNSSASRAASEKNTREDDSNVGGVRFEESALEQPQQKQ